MWCPALSKSGNYRPAWLQVADGKMMRDLSLSDDELAEVKAQVARLREWLQSDEGTEAVQRASRRAREASERRRRERQVDWRELYRPTATIKYRHG